MKDDERLTKKELKDVSNFYKKCTKNLHLELRDGVEVTMTMLGFEVTPKGEFHRFR